MSRFYFLSQLAALTILVILIIPQLAYAKENKSVVVKAIKRVDTVEEWPSFDTLWRIEKQVVEVIDEAWAIVKEKGPDTNLTYIQTNIWQRLMVQFLEAQIVKSFDLDLRFRRSPANFLDFLLGITNFDDIKKLSMNPSKDKFAFVKLRWIEMSSLCTQFLRFYNWKIRDIFNGGTGMIDIMQAYSEKKTYIWTSRERTNGTFTIIKFKGIPATVVKKIYLDDGNNDIYLGLRRLIDTDPDVLKKAKFDATTCTKGHDHIHVEPSGLDIPYYLLFFTCLVDFKHYVLINVINIYKSIFLGETFTDQNQHRAELHSRLDQKIKLFDAAFQRLLEINSPAYQMHPGLTMCNPQENVLGQSYEKFTNFVKVFMLPEVDLHKSGTCRPTCDLLDVTYKPCDFTDESCRREREKECIQTPGRCDKFNPPCPVGQYHCHNSTEKISFCPSKRPDRLYEFATGEDDDSKFTYGKNKTKCDTEMVEMVGGWKLEADTLVNTPHFCEICTCFCFEPLERYLGNFTIRHFVSRLVMSDTKANRIIVGIKFHRIKDQIHIAIADAVALPGRNVDHSTIRWIIPEYETDPRFIIRCDMDLRSLNIDDIVTDAIDRVVTGVKFYNETYKGKLTYKYIGLETVTHIINKSNATLVDGSARFRRNANSTVSRMNLLYPDPPNGPDDPALSATPPLPESTSNQYIVFRATSLDKDVAQSTIPYFDSQNLISQNPRWLKGIGILKKVSPGYGGFLAFKLIEHLYG